MKADCIHIQACDRMSNLAHQAGLKSILLLDCESCSLYLPMTQEVSEAPEELVMGTVNAVLREYCCKECIRLNPEKPVQILDILHAVLIRYKNKSIGQKIISALKETIEAERVNNAKHL